MIFLHKLNGDKFILNTTLIETIEERPDTVITLVNDRKYIVKESVPEVLDLIIKYNGTILVDSKKFAGEKVRD